MDGKSMPNNEQPMCGYELAKRHNLPAARPDEATAASVLGIINGSLLFLLALRLAIFLVATSTNTPSAGRHMEPDFTFGWLALAAFFLGGTSLVGGIGFLSGNRYKLLLASSLTTGVASAISTLWQWGLFQKEVQFSRSIDSDLLTASSDLLSGVITMILGFVITRLLVKPASEHWRAE